MKHGTSLILAASLLMCGCQGGDRPQPGQHDRVNAAIVQALNQSAIDEAIIIQHTLFPYHFVPHSAQLNSLGQRDLNVLLGHYASFPGPEQPLNVRQGDTPSALYEARVQTVARAIADAGISRANIEIRDGFAGGPGLAAEHVIVILSAEREAVQSGRRSLLPTTDGGLSR